MATMAATAPPRAERSSRLPSITIDKVLAIAAAVLFPTGILVIGLGWWGAAHTPFLFEQVPYLISGGILGLALVVVGGLLYFGSWVLRLSAQQRESADRLRETLTALREELAARPAQTVAPAPPGSATPATVPLPPIFAGYVATANGSLYHLPSCAVVDGVPALREVSATAAASMRPCRLCLPAA